GMRLARMSLAFRWCLCHFWRLEAMVGFKIFAVAVAFVAGASSGAMAQYVCPPGYGYYGGVCSPIYPPGYSNPVSGAVTGEAAGAASGYAVGGPVGAVIG